MKMEYTTYFVDGSSGMTTIEKPAGAHPDSICALQEGVRVAEMGGGKVVSRLGRSNVVAGVILDDGLLSRSEILSRQW